MIYVPCTEGRSESDQTQGQGNEMFVRVNVHECVCVCVCVMFRGRTFEGKTRKDCCKPHLHLASHTTSCFHLFFTCNLHVFVEYLLFTSHSDISAYCIVMTCFFLWFPSCPGVLIEQRLSFLSFYTQWRTKCQTHIR